jgi:2-oxoglutarate/2-oxoacid ferredoxin oxidoreductase subunit alpha
MNRKSILIRFEGQAGDGILSTGQLLARAAARCGYHVLTQSFFLSEVRGGASTFQVRLGCDRLLSTGEHPDVVIAIDNEAASRQSRQLASDGLLLHPLGCDSPALHLTAHQESHGVDWKGLAVDAGATARSQNVVAAGFAGAVVGLKCEVLEAIVARRFARDAEDAEANVRAVKAGFDRVSTLLNGTRQARRLAPAYSKPLLLLSGNEAVALGALVGGVRFYAGYPITPASEIMEILAKHLPQVDGHFIQAEDEIAALAMCLGASFGGKPAMTATAGPGLSLMCELIGLSGMAEIPVVIADVQRAGPSTGMPTKDGQGDLNVAVYGSHGDAPRAVLAAQTVADCFYQTVRAVNIAQKYHVPVILLSSQAISHSQETVELPALDAIAVYEEPFYRGPEDGEYRRYREVADGHASLRAIPGSPGGMHRTGGLEHDESGQPCADAANRVAMVERRAQRMKAIAAEQAMRELCVLPASGRCRAALIGWGRAASSAMEALDALHETGWELGSFFPHLLWPLPSKPFEDLIAAGAEVLYVCETNGSGQLAHLIRSQLSSILVAHGVEVVSVMKDDGTPLSSDEVQEQVERHNSQWKHRRGQGLELGELPRKKPATEVPLQ